MQGAATVMGHRRLLWRRLSLLVVLVTVTSLCNFTYIYLYSKDNNSLVLLPINSDNHVNTRQLGDMYGGGNYLVNVQNKIRSTKTLTITGRLAAQFNDEDNKTLEETLFEGVSINPENTQLNVWPVRKKLQILHQTTAAPFIRTQGTSTPRHNATRGYMLADDYWEQQSSGSRNLQLLQCWAGHLNLSVVEPFTEDSTFRTYLTTLHPVNKQGQPELRFSDLFDLQTWNQKNQALGHAKLDRWEDFLINTPKEVITVQFKYAYVDEVHQNRKQLKNNPISSLQSSVRYKNGCPKGWPRENQLQFLRSQHIRIVRNVCFNFEYGDFLTTEDFKKHIYDRFAPENTTVVFKQWRGTGGIGRVLVKDSPCHNTFIQEYIVPSQRLITDTQLYTLKYLTGSNTTYIAIMARLEKSKITMRRDGIVTYCLNKTISYWEQLKAESGIDTTFLSIDIGKYGSNSFRNTGDKSDLLTEFRKFFRRLYNNSLTVPTWERSFEEVSHSTDAGYIALLQKTIVTHAKCVIFVGGGSFQKHALHLYKSLHPRQDHCIRIVNECTLPKNLPLL